MKNIMGIRFTKEAYEQIKIQPEQVYGLDQDTINSYIFSYMLNDRGDFGELHKVLQESMSLMSDERLIMTSKQKGISLEPLICRRLDIKGRVELLSKITDYGCLRPEYYNKFPHHMLQVILNYIKANRFCYDFKERLTSRFDFSNFSHFSVLSICRGIPFEHQYLNRAEDIFLEYIGPQIKAIYTYLKCHSSEPKEISFKMIEGFYHKSYRLIPTLGDKKIEYMAADYPVVPIVPQDDLPDIIEMLMKENQWTREECLEYLRIDDYLSQ